jgi:hypothetical protein
MLFRVQKDKENPYVMMNKSFFLDARLSAKAKGILGYILTLPDDWRIYLEELAKHFKDGVKSITSGVNELMEYGYVLRTTLRDEKGKFKGYMYDVFEVSTETPKTENGKTENGKTENGKRHTTNILLKLNNNIQSNNTQSDSKTLCVEIQNILGEKLTPKAVQGLINGSSLEVVKHYISNWDRYKPFAKTTQSAYFIHCIQNNIPIPTIQATTYPPSFANFDQRDSSQYEDDKFYANLST